MPGADVERGNRPPGTQGRLTEYLPPSRRSSSSNAFIAAVPSAAASSAGAIPSASISQNLRKSSSSEPSPCNTKTPASGVRFRTALPHVIQPRRVSTATDPPVALLMRPSIPTNTSTTSGALCSLCLGSISVTVLAGAPSEDSVGAVGTSPHTRGITSACIRVQAPRRLEPSAAPSRNSTRRHRRSGPTRPPSVVKRQRSWGPVSPRTSATSFRMKETSAPVSKRQFTNT
ncbi:hypothetical protein T08_8036 [Trichinella sp. T8]|nr:hypothetical protein T08_8036 [Trichinella sp. T8]